MSAIDELRRALAKRDSDAVITVVASSWRELTQQAGRDGAELTTAAAAATTDAPPSAGLATLRYAAGLVAFRAGDNARCRELSHSALDVAVEVGSDEEQARAHVGLSRADF